MAGFTLLPVILAMSLIAAIAFLLNRDSGMNAGMVASQSDADRARYTAEAGLQAVNAIAQGKNCTGYTDLGTTAFGAHSFTATVNPKSGTPVTLTAAATTDGGASASLTRSNVVVYQTTPNTLNLQPGTTGVDTYIRSSNPSGNYGGDTILKIGKIGPGQSVALVQFDLSFIPAGSTILSAQFSLYHTTGGNDMVSAFGVTKPWTEGTGAAGSGATWSTYNGAQSWATAGGDYDPALGVTIALPGNNAWAIWDLAAQTAAWTAGTQPNYGIALVETTGSGDAFVSSDEMSSITLRPKLTVNFLPPCGWVPPATGVTLQASQDTWIDEAHSNANYGNATSFTVTNASKRGRGLVQFDLSSIAAGTVLKSATLRLFTGSFSPKADSILTVNPVNVPWTEGGANWKTADGSSNSWKCGCFGGNFAAAAASATISSTFVSGWVEWDVTALAQEWLDGIVPNYGAGVLIDTSSAAIFDSREFTVNQPQLVITY
jgi:hypothetical protein